MYVYQYLSLILIDKDSQNFTIYFIIFKNTSIKLKFISKYDYKDLIGVLIILLKEKQIKDFLNAKLRIRFVCLFVLI